MFNRPKENSLSVVIYCCTVTRAELSGCKQPPIISHQAVGRGLIGARWGADLQWGQSCIHSQLVGQLSLAAQGQPWFMMDKLAAGRDDDGSPVLPQAGLGLFTGKWPESSALKAL